MKKRIVLVLVALLCMTALLCFAASADQPKVIASGEHDGGPVTWKITSDGVLTISGNRSVQDMNAKDYLWHPYAEVITKVVVEDGITTIPSHAFYNMANLKEVFIGNAVTSIGKYAFYGCTSLESVNFPDSLQTIGESAFMDCTALKSAVFGQSLETIGKYAFMNCTHLAEVTFALDGFLTEIGDKAFAGSGIVSLETPESMKLFGSHAFAECASLEKIVIHNGQATYPSIFQDCVALKEIVAHKGASLTGYDIFKGCDAIERVEIHTSAISGLEGSKNLTHATIYAEAGVVQNFLFNGCSALRSVTIESGITAIGADAFGDCVSLEEVVLPDTVTRIYAGSFRNSGVKRLAIGSSVTEIEITAFSGSALTEVAFHGDVPNIGTWTLLFSDVTATAYYPADNETWTESKLIGYGGNLTWIPADCSAGHVVEQLAAGTATCTRTGLTDGSRCFYCGEIVEVQRETSATSHNFGRWLVTKQSTTEAQGSKKRICMTCGEVETQSIDKLEAPAENTCGENLTWSFKDGVLTISGTGNMYEYAKDTQSPWWDIRNEVKKVVLTEGVTNIADKAFYSFTNVEEVVIPDTVVSIGDMAFESCQKLKKTTIPDGVTSIGFRAFSGCRKLQSVTIPDSVEFIGRYAFRNCVLLTEVHVGSGVTQIDIGAFEGCSSLEKIYFYGDMPYGLEACFKNIKTTAYYPAGNDTWTEEGMKNNEQGAKITWKPYCYDEHSYGDWVTVKEPTEDEEGRKEKTCSICGDVKSKSIDKLEPTSTEPPATEPPATEPPATEPPATEPPATEPPATEPPATEPPATEPPATEPAPTEPAPTDPAPAPTEPAPTEPDGAPWGIIAIVAVLVLAAGAALVFLKKKK